MGFVETRMDFIASYEQNVFGSFEANVKRLEDELKVKLTIRNDELKIQGEPKNTVRAKRIIEQLVEMAKKGNDIGIQQIEYLISNSDEELSRVSEIDDETVYHTLYGKPIKPKTFGQVKYVESIKKNMVTFGIGPAGTGKTYLAMAMAVKAFKNEEVGRIVLTRPAIEVGEKLGFLPGDLQSKIDPYLRPLYDALYQLMGAENVIKNMEKGLIEVAPLAYMRGRTLDNAFIILDEAQNTTQAQMKMFLTRIGFNSRVVITGDNTQKDLPIDVTSGLDIAAVVLKSIEDIEFCHFTNRDVVRHHLVQKIVKAYEDFELKNSENLLKKDKKYLRKS